MNFQIETNMNDRVPHRKSNDFLKRKWEDGLGYITDVYLAFLQLAFNRRDVGDYKYTEGDDSEIVITDQYPIDYNDVDKLPHIVIMRGQVAFSGSFFGSLVDQNNLTGEKKKSDLLSAMIIISCVSKHGREAQKLGFEIAKLIKMNTATLTKQGIHKIGEDIGIGAETSPGQLVVGTPDDGPIMVQVTSPLYFFESWKTEPFEPELAKALSLRLGIPEDSSSRGLNQPRIRGKVIKV